MQNILEVNRLTKDFIQPLSLNKLIKFEFAQRKPLRVLEDISFSLPRGKILGIIGPNGAGKTTLLKTIATLIIPKEGSISFHSDKNTLEWPSQNAKIEEKIKFSIGMVMEEERSFYWRLTGRQNLEFFAGLYKLDKKTIESRINELLKLFNIDYAGKRFDSYSTGMKKIFALIRGLMHNPDLLLLDEPAKSMDYKSSLNLKNFIKDNLVKIQDKTVIFTTHNLDEASDFADIVMILSKGKLAAFGTMDDLRKKTDKPKGALSEIFLKLTDN